MPTIRDEFRHDWEQGDYVSGSIIEDRFDWDDVDRLEQHAVSMLEDWQERGNIGIAFSAGIDGLTIMDLAARNNLDIPIMSALSPEWYPGSLEYNRGMVERYNLPYYEYFFENMGMDYLKDNPDVRVFPDGGTRRRQIHKQYHPAIRDFMDDADLWLFCSGRRNEHNVTPDYATDRRMLEDGEYEGCPIKDWDVAHVLAYLTKYDVPIMPIYEKHDAGSGVWYAQLSGGVSWTLDDPRKNWWLVRETCMGPDYVEFWTDHIAEHFPNADEKAAGYAVEHNKEHTSVEEGRKKGADVNPVIPDSFDGC